MKQDGGMRVVDQSFHSKFSMVVVAQLVRALVCGTRGREFNSPQSPKQRDVVQLGRTLALGARGRWFKSSHLDKKSKKNVDC